MGGAYLRGSHEVNQARVEGGVLGLPRLDLPLHRASGAHDLLDRGTLIELHHELLVLLRAEWAVTGQSVAENRL
jgi:hypothetical protein